MQEVLRNAKVRKIDFSEYTHAGVGRGSKRDRDPSGFAHIIRKMFVQYKHSFFEPVQTRGRG